MVDISELASKKFYHILMLSSCDSVELRLDHHLDGMLLCCICADCCTAVADLPTRVTLLIFLAGVCSTQNSLCTVIFFFFFCSKPSLYVVLFRVSTFSLLLYYFFYETCTSLSV